jgi:membrane protein DedA with SNARE-associated domain
MVRKWFPDDPPFINLIESSMFDWISEFIRDTGYLGVALLMFGENVFPPIPSELIMPLAGFNASRGEMNVFLLVASGSVGSLAGAFVWYAVARRVGIGFLKRAANRHGRWLAMTPKDIDDAIAWFHNHGRSAVLFGRLIPAVRTLISVPAGLTRMETAIFLAYSGIGTVLWTSLLVAAGYLLGGQHRVVETYLNPVTNLVVVLALAGYLYRVITWKRSPT